MNKVSQVQVICFFVFFSIIMLIMWIKIQINYSNTELIRTTIGLYKLFSACRVFTLASCYKPPTGDWFWFVQYVKIFVALLENPKLEAFLLYFASTVPSLSFSLT